MVQLTTPHQSKIIMTNKFNVHFYETVRVKVASVRAKTAVEAIATARDMIDLHSTIGIGKPIPLAGGATIETVEWDEGPNQGALVDPLLEDGEVDYENSGVFDDDLVPARSTRLSHPVVTDGTIFYKELQERFAVAGGLAKVLDPETLVDLLGVYNAILTGAPHEVFRQEGAKVAKIIQSLPSAEKWSLYLKTGEVSPAEEAGHLLCLEVSSAHITSDTNQWLTSVAGTNEIAMTVARYEYGYFLSPCDQDPEVFIPQDLKLVISHAQSLGYALIRLDADAPIHPELPRYEW